MKIIKIVDGRITIVNERGIFLFPTFGKDIVSAFYNDKQDLIVATLRNGKVELFTERGLVRRTVVNTDAVNARLSGDDLIIDTIRNKTEIRSQTGMLKKTI